jgi:transcriptional regulator with XRE-family HTH domain
MGSGVTNIIKTGLPPAEGLQLAASGTPGGLLGTLGANLRRLRVRQGYSLDRMAAHSGVSRAMISQVETGKSAPTISLLGKLADSLGVGLAQLLSVNSGPPTTVLLRHERAKVVLASNGRFSVRPLFERGTPGEFYEVKIAAAHVEEGERRFAGVRAHIVVARGAVELAVGSGEPVTLGTGDALIFAADEAHSYRNLGDGESTLYLAFFERGKV